MSLFRSDRKLGISGKPPTFDNAKQRLRLLDSGAATPSVTIMLACKYRVTCNVSSILRCYWTTTQKWSYQSWLIFLCLLDLWDSERSCWPVLWWDPSESFVKPILFIQTLNFCLYTSYWLVSGVVRQQNVRRHIGSRMTTDDVPELCRSCRSTLPDNRLLPQWYALVSTLILTVLLAYVWVALRSMAFGMPTAWQCRFSIIRRLVRASTEHFTGSAIFLLLAL